MLKKILLINPPTIDLNDYKYEHAKIRGYPLYPPIAVATIAASIKRKLGNSIEIKIFDLEYELVKKIIGIKSSEGVFDLVLTDAVEAFKPQLVGISFNYGLSALNVIKICRKLKEINKDIITFTGGNHATLFYEMVMNSINEMDYLLRFEVDETILDFFRYINKDIDVSKVAGLVYRDQDDHKIRVNQYNNYPNNLDELPIPEWSLTKFQDYYKFGRIGAIFNYGDPELPTYTMSTARGCGGRCKYCSVRPFNGPVVRGKSASAILKEIDYAYNELGIKQLEILDDDFTFNRKRVLEVAEGLIKKNYDLKWNLLNGIRLITLNEEMIDKFAASGLRLISVGIESGHREILKKIRKPLSIEQLYKKMELLNKYPEIYVKGNFIVGFPYETWEHINETVSVARNLLLDWYILSIYTPHPGTEMFKEITDILPNFVNDYQKSEIKWDTFEFDGDMSEKFDFLKCITGISFKELNEFIVELNLDLNFLNNKNLKGRDIDRAIRDFEGVLKFVKPDHAIAHYCLSEAYKRKGNMAKSKKSFREHKTTIANDPYWMRMAEKFKIENKVQYNA